MTSAPIDNDDNAEAYNDHSNNKDNNNNSNNNSSSEYNEGEDDDDELSLLDLHHAMSLHGTPTNRTISEEDDEHEDNDNNNDNDNDNDEDHMTTRMIHLCRFHANLQPLQCSRVLPPPLCDNDDDDDGYSWPTTLFDLEVGLEQSLLIDHEISRRLMTPTTMMEEEDIPPPVQYCLVPDKIWLSCQRPYVIAIAAAATPATAIPPPLPPPPTILGLWEDIQAQKQQQHHQQEYQQQSVQHALADIPIEMTVWQTGIGDEEVDLATAVSSSTFGGYSAHCNCTCPAPHRSWKRLDSKDQLATTATTTTTSPSSIHRVAWIDLQRRQPPALPTTITTTTTTEGTRRDYLPRRPLFPTRASVTHFLRCLLGVRHDASPWIHVTQGECDDNQDDGIRNGHVWDKLHEPSDRSELFPSFSSSSWAIGDHVQTVLVALPTVSHLPDLPSASEPVLLDYRVSDAAPSWCLYSVVVLQQQQQQSLSSSVRWRWPWHVCLETTAPTSAKSNAGTCYRKLLVYRKLPPRERLYRYPPYGVITSRTLPPGCLWERYTPPSSDGFVDESTKQETMDASSSSLNDDNDDDDDIESNRVTSHISNTTRTTTIRKNGINRNHGQNDGRFNPTAKTKNNPVVVVDDWVNYRFVSPPFLNAVTEYPGMFEQLLQHDHLHIMQQEVAGIAQWTAWPEQQHYSVDPNNNNNNDNNNDNHGSNTGNNHPKNATWTVFPLCYCFPANEISNRVWIPTTCSIVPQTVQLLHDAFGDTIRTALYSRLASDSILQAHTGWQDLANHVLRIHIPLVIPNNNNNNNNSNDHDGGHGNNGDGDGHLCGLWVDGCVAIHRSMTANATTTTTRRTTHPHGQQCQQQHQQHKHLQHDPIRLLLSSLVAFDDSKTHRAFNYSNQDRIVLIVDLLRPTDLPAGTATGGHSNELDQFISQYCNGGDGGGGL